MNDILCPTDFTPAADVAKSLGALIAARWDASVTVLHVMDKDHAKQGDALTSAKSLLTHAEERLKKVSRVRTLHREGDFMKEIAAESAKGHSLMVVGTHGAQGLRQSLFGADILKLVRKVTIPSLVVQDKTSPSNDFKKILMPVAGHMDISMLLDTVVKLAQAFGSEVHVFQVMRPGEEPSDQLLKNKLAMLERMRSEKIPVQEVNEPTTKFSVGFAEQTTDYAARIKASTIAIMARASDEYRYIADAEKERLLSNTAAVPVLCAV
jgi:nucleotide-binding universal stress UspA family protein